MGARSTLRFLHRGKVIELTDVGPTETVLDYLRLRAARMGTKEGCAEGDCGACTVAVGTLRTDAVEGEPRHRIDLQPINACITFLGMLDGKELITVDDLAGPAGELHPVQAAMVDEHGSQCGFCTPGFVMSLFALYHQRNGKEAAAIGNPRPVVNDWLAGNLCRCTGYAPIARAASSVCFGVPEDAFSSSDDARVARLLALRGEDDLFIGDPDRFFAAPRSLDALCELHLAHPDATLVAGATDVGLWVTKQLRHLPRLIHLGRVEELGRIDWDDEAQTLTMGAGVTYSDAEPVLAGLDPDLQELLRRLGGRQVRASGTIGGNIANGSPIGDSPPALIALGASIVLRRGRDSRELPLEDFFLDYGRQDRQPGEVLTHIKIPRLSSNQRFRCFKVSKRLDQDISGLMGAFRLTIENGLVQAARIAFGGMAATPRRATSAEEGLVGADLSKPATWQPALEALGEDYRPIDDLRASNAYRLQVARGLLEKALLECGPAAGRATRITSSRDFVAPAGVRT